MPSARHASDVEVLVPVARALVPFRRPGARRRGDSPMPGVTSNGLQAKVAGNSGRRGSAAGRYRRPGH